MWVWDFFWEVFRRSVTSSIADKTVKIQNDYEKKNAPAKTLKQIESDKQKEKELDIKLSEFERKQLKKDIEFFKEQHK